MEGRGVVFVTALRAMMQFIIKMLILTTGSLSSPCFHFTPAVSWEAGLSLDQCIPASKSIFIPSTEINLRFRQYRMCTKCAAWAHTPCLWRRNVFPLCYNDVCDTFKEPRP